jgi:hypothetical protein
MIKSDELTCVVWCTYILVVVVGIESRALHMLGNLSTTELLPR